MFDPETAHGTGDELPTATPVTPSQEAARAPHHALWLLYLYFRPRAFFRHFVLDPSPGLTALAAWLLGMTGAMDRIDSQAMKAELGTRTSPFEFITTWSAYWLACAGLGILGGMFYFMIGGWWYAKRLVWSGVVDPDRTLARRVYLFASQVYAIPTILYALWVTENYATPQAAYDGDDWGAVFIAVPLFWSIYTSYRGVRTAFVVRPWAARMWFLILPGALYSVALVAVTVAFLAVSGLFATTPTLEAPQELTRPGFSVSYPANWNVDTTDPDYDPDHYVGIGPLWVDGAVYITIFDVPVTAADAVEGTLLSLKIPPWRIVSRSEITRWGSYEGHGYEIVAENEGVSYSGRAFVHTTDTGSFEIMELCETEQHPSQAPGFAMIENTFRFKPQHAEK